MKKFCKNIVSIFRVALVILALPGVLVFAVWADHLEYDLKKQAGENVCINDNGLRDIGGYGAPHNQRVVVDCNNGVRHILTKGEFRGNI